MSEPIVHAVFSLIPDTPIGTLVGIASEFPDAFAIVDQRVSDGFEVSVWEIREDEARELAMMPGRFVEDLRSLPERQIWPGKEGEE